MLRKGVTGSDLDLSGWARREQARDQQARALVARVEGARDGLRSVLAAHGVREAWLFGSIARGAARPDSDVDIAVAGCPPEHFYRLAAELERVLDAPVDVIDLDRSPTAIRESVREDGSRLYP